LHNAAGGLKIGLTIQEIENRIAVIIVALMIGIWQRHPVGSLLLENVGAYGVLLPNLEILVFFPAFA
jgi:hypothetical protein